MILKSAVFQKLLEDMRSMPVIDTHEHLLPEKIRLVGKQDFFHIYFSQYAMSDLVSAGMTEEDVFLMKESNQPQERKIEIFLPYWRRISNTGYARAIKLAVRDLYGVDRIDAASILEIDRQIQEQSQQGLYEEVLQKKSNIRFCVWDQLDDSEAVKDDFLRLALRLDDYVFIQDASDIEKLEKKFNISVTNPNDIENMMEVCITNHKNKGLVALKSALAYMRSIHYQAVSKTVASLALDKIRRCRFSDEDVKNLQDFLMCSVAEKACWHNLPLQIHTGHQEGNGNFIANGRPSDLTDLISSHPDTHFDLFHGGYPYGGELSSMAKMFKNVSIDMCWVHSISPEFSKRYLAEWLDTVPANKILGFGGDSVHAESSYGQLQVAMENIAVVLAQKVEDGCYSYDEATSYARMLLHDNAEALFGMA